MTVDPGDSRWAPLKTGQSWPLRFLRGTPLLLRGCLDVSVAALALSQSDKLVAGLGLISGMTVALSWTMPTALYMIDLGMGLEGGAVLVGSGIFATAGLLNLREGWLRYRESYWSRTELPTPAYQAIP